MWEVLFGVDGRGLGVERWLGCIEGDVGESEQREDRHIREVIHRHSLQDLL